MEAQLPKAVRKAISENADEEYDWRVVGGVATLVVVGVQFTLAGEVGEEYAAFRRRMTAVACALGPLLRHPCVRLSLHRRTAAGRRPWAEFDCRTPNYGLPAPEVLPG